MLQPCICKWKALWSAMPEKNYVKFVVDLRLLYGNSFTSLTYDVRSVLFLSQVLLEGSQARPGGHLCWESTWITWQHPSQQWRGLLAVWRCAPWTRVLHVWLPGLQTVDPSTAHPGTQDELMLTYNSSFHTALSLVNVGCFSFISVDIVSSQEPCLLLSMRCSTFPAKAAVDNG